MTLPHLLRLPSALRSFRLSRRLVLSLALGLMTACTDAAGAAAARDIFSDTWVATDALGRPMPSAIETGPPRADRTVGLFYFLWHGAHAQGGPFDIARILAADPDAMRKPDSPLWGPLHVPHHWGESIFGYYRLQDDGLLRKHAQMLADAGVDVVLFDISNQFTYRDDYFALLRVWSEVRAAGNRTPQVAFLTPFWDPPKAVRELWRDLYRPGHHRDLWFQWEGRPLLLADPELLDARVEFRDQDTPVALRPGTALGQQFRSARPFLSVGGRFPTWRSRGAAVTLTLRRDSPAGERVATERFTDVADNSWLLLKLTNALPAGTYHLEATDPAGTIGWWSHTKDSQRDGHATADGREMPGDRTLRLTVDDPEVRAIREFFTFRAPQPDYFEGPTRPGLWSWLEVSPQHVFRDAQGRKEQMSVGVAQNAVAGRLGAMSEPGAHGRSHHDGATDPRPGAVLHGLNFAAQAAHALREDPRFVFITGWNEWIAGRFKEFNGVRHPVMFVDQFDQEHSRDIEPMRGGHGDNYFYQMTSFIRRYKGARPIPPVRSAPASQPIRIDGDFADWATVAPEFRDTVGDPARRDAPGWDTRVRYRNDTGRNDLVATKVSVDARGPAFYVRTAAPLTSSTGTNWMVLMLDVDGVATNGWLGYDVVVNRAGPGVVERQDGAGFQWRRAGTAEWRAQGAELELSMRWSDLGLREIPASMDFKWGDHLQLDGEWSDFTLNGDVAPNDRFNYRAVLREGDPKR